MSCWTCSTAACITFPSCPRPVRSWAWSTTATWSRRRRASRSCCAAPSTWPASAADLVSAAAGLSPMIIALHDARVAAEQVAAIRSVVLDALTRRLVELAVADAGRSPGAVHLVRARQPGPAGGRAVLRRRQRARLAGRGRRAGRGRLHDAGGPRGGRGPAGVRAAARRARRERGPTRCSRGRWRPGVPPREPQRGPRPGAGAHPRVDDHRQPPGVGADPGAGRPGRRRAVARRGATPTCCGCWPGSRCRSARPPGSCAISWSSTRVSGGDSSTSSTAG